MAEGGGSQVGEMFIRMHGRDAEVLTAFNRVESRGHQTARSLGSTAEASSTSFSRIGAAAGIMSATVVTAVMAVVGVLAMFGVGLASVAMHTIKLASEAEDTAGKFNVVFGSAAEDTSKKLEDMAQRLGKSRIELMQMASQTQDTFVPLGFARDTAAGMSLAVTELAQDLASFSPEAGNSAEAMAALQSALIGNHETMRKYGVIINDTVLSQQLMKMGIEGGTQAASEQQKILARLQLIMAGTSDAQGDLERTSTSYTNTADSFRSVMKDLGIQIGSILMPSFTEIIGKLRDLVLWFQINEEVVTLWQDRVAAATRFVIGGVESMWYVISNADLIWEGMTIAAAEAMMSAHDRVKWFADNSWIAIEWFFTNFWEIAQSIGQNYIQMWVNVFENFDTIVSAGMDILAGNTDRGMKDLVSTMTKDFKYVTSSPEFKEFQATDFTHEWNALSDKWAERTMKNTEEVASDLQEKTKLDFDSLFAGVEGRADKASKKAKASIGDLEGAFQSTLLARFEGDDPNVRAVGELTDVVRQTDANEDERHRELIEAVSSAPGFIVEG